MILFPTSKIQGTILSLRSDIGIRVAQSQRMFENQSLITEVKVICPMIGEIILHIGKNPRKARALLASVIHSNCKQLVGLRVGSTATETFSTLYPRLCFETVFLALKLTQNCYLHYNISIFFLKTGNVIINWLLLSYTTCRTERLSSPSDYIYPLEIGDFENPNFQTVSWIGKNLEGQPKIFKNPNFSSLSSWIGKNIEIYPSQNQHFKIQILNLWIIGKTYVLI